MATRIMVVDDEPAIGKLLLYQLSGFGYQVSYIQDGLLALQRLTAERPDLVLLDVMMPHISGWEICRQIRAYSTVPVIMLTAKNADPDIVNGLRAGADDYVTKPYSMAQLHARIEAVLRRMPAAASPRSQMSHSRSLAWARMCATCGSRAGSRCCRPSEPAMFAGNFCKRSSRKTG